MRDKRLFRTAPPFHGVENIVQRPIFHPEHHVGIVQPEIEVADDDAPSHPRQLNAEIAADRRFSDSALPRRYDDLSCSHTSSARAFCMNFIIIVRTFF